ncbi:MAG TPA: PAS domain S-box protein [Polyangiaceae bacterium]|jgi:PAS domain S-box-containing protein|nr:PAS domain S-box protein [Polyangiaceae bacterium]
MDPKEVLSDIGRALSRDDPTYRLVMARELEPMSILDPATGCIIDVNEAWLELYGYTRDELAAGLKVTDVSAEPERTSAAIAQAPTKSASQSDIRWHRSKDGTVFPVELTCSRAVLDGRTLIVSVMRDLTRGDSARRALARSDASFRALIENMPDGIVVHRHGSLVYMNAAFRAMLGYSRHEDVRGMRVLEIVHDEDRDGVVERVRDLLKRGTPSPPREERLVRKDGTPLIAEIVGHNVIFEGESAVLVIARDVTARKELDARLIMTDRLASLGRLSASIGHELNNPLGYVLGNVTLVERELAREDVPKEIAERLAPHVRMVREGAMRMRDIVHDLKTLARGDSDPAMMIDVAQILDTCVNMAEHELGPRARIVKDYRDRPFVHGTEARLGQVFLNLLLNAAQAIPVGKPDENEVRVSIGSLDVGRVEIRIADSGEGIAAENLERIFEPFFTTKRGVGTGLGLSISHGIVTAAGGAISVEPNPGGGTVFRVVLPAG